MYKAKLKESFRDLSVVEKFNLRDTTNALSINKNMDETGAMIIDRVVNYAIMDVHNDALETQDYVNLFIMSANGQVYYSSSTSLIEDIIAIGELVGDEENAESFSIKIRTVPSKKQQQGFLKATLENIYYAEQ